MAIVDMLPQPGGSSEETLTLLWSVGTIPSTYSNGSVPLKDPVTQETASLNDYKRVRIVFRPFPSTTEEYFGVVDVAVEFLLRSVSVDNRPYIGLFGKGESYNYARGAYIPTASQATLDSIYFLHCFRLDGSVSTSTSDKYCIPVEIYGIK